mgnify:CR=1 FL=1
MLSLHSTMLARAINDMFESPHHYPVLSVYGDHGSYVNNARAELHLTLRLKESINPKYVKQSYLKHTTDNTIGFIIVEYENDYIVIKTFFEKWLEDLYDIPNEKKKIPLVNVSYTRDEIIDIVNECNQYISNINDTLFPIVKYETALHNDSSSLAMSESILNRLRK